jgi:hypothetical protein
VLNLAGGPEAKPRLVGPVANALGPVCWADGGKALLYARSEQPLPPDCWESGQAGTWAGGDLFFLDPATAKETRLSRGGGFNLFSPTTGGTLYFLVWQNDPAGRCAHLWGVPLAAAQDFAVREPDLPPRDQAAWTKLIDQVLEEAGVPGDAGGERLAADVLVRLADTFAKVYRDRFRAEPPADAGDWERQQRELQALNLPTAQRPRFALVLGAAEGEYLRRRHGAVWHLAGGPLVGAMPAEETNPFGLVMNPFQLVRSEFLPVDEEDDEEGLAPPLALKSALIRAAGRTLVMANSPAAGKGGLQALADPALARAAELLAKDHGDDADGVLLDLVQQKKHAANHYLVLHAGKLLYDHKRFKALRTLLEGRVEALPPEPRKYNLLGLALLASDSKGAAAQFRNALRCDLYYGPAYLNLAQAYANANNPVDAALCLRRLLRLMPQGPLAADARQRLAALQGGAPRGMPAPGGGPGDP